MTDEQYIREFAKRFNLQIVEYHNEMYLRNDALELGAQKALNFRLSDAKNWTLVDFFLDGSGNCVGVGDDQIDGFISADHLNK